VQSEEWDALMIKIFGTENLEDDHLTEEEDKVVQPGIPTLPTQPPNKSRNTFRSKTAKKKKAMKDVGREVNKLMMKANANKGERLMNMP
jgi:hypothetical protein